MNPLPRFFTALLLLATSSPATKPATTQPTAVPVAAVWYEISFPRMVETEVRRLGVGVWSDGTVVWSTNEKHVGKPYQTAKIDPARVTKLVTDLDAAGFFTDDKAILQHSSYPPDASYFAIGVTVEHKRQRLVSWHNPAQSESDRFNEIFNRAQELIRAVVPAEGQAVERIDTSVFELGRTPRALSPRG